MINSPDSTTHQIDATHPFIPGDSLVKWVVILLSLNIFLNLVAMGSTYAEINLLSQAIEGQLPTEQEAEVNDNRQLIIGVSQIVTFILTAILFSRWVYRAYRNLSPLGARGLKHSPGWAVAYFFIPFVNLYRPYQAVKEIWQASNPEIGLTSSAWQKAPTSFVLGAWWVCWIASGMLNRLVNRMSTRAETLSSLMSADWISLIAEVLLAIAAIFAILVVTKINTMQNEKHRRVTMPWT